MIRRTVQSFIVALMFFCGFSYAGEVTFVEHLISDNFENPEFSFPADIDEDGDIDVAVVARIDGKISWFDNDGGSPPIFTERIVGNSLDVRGVFVIDVDGDGDLDILTTSALYGGREVLWWESDGAIPPNFSKHKISVRGDDWYPVFATDLDDDGDTDILVGNGPGGAYANRVVWLENNGNSPPSFTERVISTAVNWPYRIFAIDLDDDGDIDVLSASRWDDKIAWYENDGGSPPVFFQRVISTNIDQASHVYAADLDGDGDLDVLSGSVHAYDYKIAWYENDGKVLPTFTEQIIISTADGPIFTFPSDVDDDGDTDVLAALTYSDKFVWYDNDGKISPTFTERIIASPVCPPPHTVCFAPRTIYGCHDIDGDGDSDVLALMATNKPVQYTGGKLLWYENISISNLNNYVTFEPDRSTYSLTPDTTNCQAGAVGKFSFYAKLTNISQGIKVQTNLSNLTVEVEELTNGNLLLADGRLFGEGKRFEVPKNDGYADGILFGSAWACNYRENVDILFTVCLKNSDPFRLLVDVYGNLEYYWCGL